MSQDQATGATAVTCWGMRFSYSLAQQARRYFNQMLSLGSLEANCHLLRLGQSPSADVIAIIRLFGTVSHGRT